MRIHVWILAAGHYISAIGLLLSGLALLLPMLGAGWVIGVSEGEWMASAFFGAWGLTMAALCVIGSLPGFLLGTGLLMRSNIARVFSIVLGVLGMLAFPVGTLWGAYTFWVLTDDGVTDWFVGGGLR